MITRRPSTGSSAVSSGAWNSKAASGALSTRAAYITTPQPTQSQNTLSRASGSVSIRCTSASPKPAGTRAAAAAARAAAIATTPKSAGISSREVTTKTSRLAMVGTSVVTADQKTPCTASLERVALAGSGGGMAEELEAKPSAHNLAVQRGIMVSSAA